jgi:hypothetical protein
MSIRVYALWPINVARGVMENRITASVVASSAQEARAFAADAARVQAIDDFEMWLEPERTCCIDLMNAGETPEGFVRLHHTPDWRVTLPRGVVAKPGAARQAT